MLVFGCALNAVGPIFTNGVLRSIVGRSSVEMCPAVDRWSWVTVSRQTGKRGVLLDADFLWTDRYIVRTL